MKGPFGCAILQLLKGQPGEFAALFHGRGRGRGVADASRSALTLRMALTTLVVYEGARGSAAAWAGAKRGWCNIGLRESTQICSWECLEAVFHS